MSTSSTTGYHGWGAPRWAHRSKNLRLAKLLLSFLAGRWALSCRSAPWSPVHCKPSVLITAPPDVLYVLQPSFICFLCRVTWDTGNVNNEYVMSSKNGYCPALLFQKS